MKRVIICFVFFMFMCGSVFAETKESFEDLTPKNKGIPDSSYILKGSMTIQDEITDEISEDGNLCFINMSSKDSSSTVFNFRVMTVTMLSKDKTYTYRKDVVLLNVLNGYRFKGDSIIIRFDKMSPKTFDAEFSDYTEGEQLKGTTISFSEEDSKEIIKQCNTASKAIVRVSFESVPSTAEFNLTGFSALHAILEVQSKRIKDYFIKMSKSDASTEVSKNGKEISLDK